MTTPSVKVSSRYQIAIPQQVRKQLSIKSGDHLLLDIQDGLIILMPKPQNYTRQLAGLHHEIWEKSGEYLNREREAWNGLSGASTDV